MKGEPGSVRQQNNEGEPDTIRQQAREGKPVRPR